MPTGYFDAKKKSRSVPAGEVVLPETLWERIVAIQPSTSTAANFLNSKNKRQHNKLKIHCCL